MFGSWYFFLHCFTFHMYSIYIYIYIGCLHHVYKFSIRVHPADFSGVRVVLSVVFCVKSVVYHCLFFFVWLLYWLSCDWWLLITTLVCSNFTRVLTSMARCTRLNFYDIVSDLRKVGGGFLGLFGLLHQ